MSGHSQREAITPFPEVIRSLSNNTIVIGDLARWEAEGRMDTPLDGFRFIAIAALTEEFMTQAEPDIILSPLIADDFDAIEVAIRLVDLGYNGKYRVISDDLPSAAMVRNEIKSIAQGLDFDLLLMPQTD